MCIGMYTGMYKNQLQELAQRSCFNLPSYSCIREGPDHAPRFKATVNFNGETFESPSFCSTLRQAEHAAAEVALNTLANRGPSKALAARVLVSIQLKYFPSLASLRDLFLAYCWIMCVFHAIRHTKGLVNSSLRAILSSECSIRVSH